MLPLQFNASIFFMFFMFQFLLLSLTLQYGQLVETTNGIGEVVQIDEEQTWSKKKKTTTHAKQASARRCQYTVFIKEKSRETRTPVYVKFNANGKEMRTRVRKTAVYCCVPAVDSPWRREAASWRAAP